MTLASYIRGAYEHFTEAPEDQRFQEFLVYLKEQAACTPDVARLTRKAKHLLFVYDGCMKGHPLHDEYLRDHSTFQATAFTAEYYSLWKKKLGELSFPVPLKQSYTGAPLAPVKGELYSITTDQLMELDKQLENGVEFKRVRTKIQIPFRTIRFMKERVLAYMPDEVEPQLLSQVLADQEIGQVDAYVYVGRLEYWLPQLDAGYLFEPVCRYFNAKQNLDYYYFSIQEYDD